DLDELGPIAVIEILVRNLRKCNGAKSLARVGFSFAAVAAFDRFLGTGEAPRNEDAKTCQ
ncbi:MAG TPA: hypothetical protein DCE52_13020, partial [Rhodobacteraceae bacterium]|nr:hypothetical protein [Paracoccaceae bacterium]